MTSGPGSAASRPPTDAKELQRQRAAARKMGWWFGAGALALYLIGFFIGR